MTTHRQLNVTLALALAIAAICVFAPIAMDGSPTELDAIEATAASVVDAQAAAAAAAHFPTLIATQDRP